MNIWSWVPWERKELQTRRGKTDFFQQSVGGGEERGRRRKRENPKQPNSCWRKILCFWRRQVCCGKPRNLLREDIIKRNYTGLPTRRVHQPAHVMIHPQSVLLKSMLSDSLRLWRYTALEKVANRVIWLCCRVTNVTERSDASFPTFHLGDYVLNIKTSQAWSDKPSLHPESTSDDGTVWRLFNCS